jgi:hypothetical protein
VNGAYQAVRVGVAALYIWGRSPNSNSRAQVVVRDGISAAPSGLVMGGWSTQGFAFGLTLAIVRRRCAPLESRHNAVSLGYHPPPLRGLREKSIDIGGLSPAFPVTPPDMRVRIRRFGGLSYRLGASLGTPSESK